MKAAETVGQLTFVDDKPTVNVVIANRIQNLVERNDYVLEIGLEQFWTLT